MEGCVTYINHQSKNKSHPITRSQCYHVIRACSVIRVLYSGTTPLTGCTPHSGNTDVTQLPHMCKGGGGG